MLVQPVELIDTRLFFLSSDTPSYSPQRAKVEKHTQRFGVVAVFAVVTMCKLCLNRIV